MKKLLKKLLEERTKRVLTISVFSAMFLILITISLQEFVIFQPEKGKSVTWGNLLRKSLLKSEPNTDPKRFLFVDTSTSNALIQSSEPPFQNSVITDRGKLATFLGFLKDDPQYTYIIADIVFADPSESDSLLENVIDSLPRFITCSYTNNQEMVVNPIFDMDCGLCDIQKLDGDFVQYKLRSENGEKALPLKVFEAMPSSTIHKPWGINLNSFVLNYRITKHDLTSRYTLTDLCSLVFLGKDVVKDMANNRIIVIGDFKASDKVSTSIGEVPGPLVLTNVILALENKDNILTFFKLSILFLGFFFFSFVAIYPENLMKKVFSKISDKNLLIKVTIEGLEFGLLIGLCSIIYFAVFNIYLNFIYLGTYFFTLNYISRNFRSIKFKIRGLLPWRPRRMLKSN